MYSQHSDSTPSSQSTDQLFELPAQRLDVLIEQLQTEDCPNLRLPLFKAVNYKLKRAVFFTPRCKLWSCPVCSKVNKELWTWRAAHGAKVLRSDGHELQFVTLTSHEKLNAAGSIRVLPKAWKKVHERMKRAAPGSQYFIVPEAHENGRVHLHMITSAQLAKRFWKDVPRACGMGYQSDLQEVQNDGSVAAYVGKYMTKTLQFSNFGKGFRRARTSQGWPKLPELERDASWLMYRLPTHVALADDIEQLEKRGFSVVRAGSKSAWSYIDADKQE